MAHRRQSAATATAPSYRKIQGSLPADRRREKQRRADPRQPDPDDRRLNMRAVLGITALALGVWVVIPEAVAGRWIALAAGLVLAMRLVRWRGVEAMREPLVWVLHLGYAWLAVGLLLLGLNGLMPL